MSPDDPEQFSEDRIELYKKFAGAFNKALNFKYVWIVSMNSDDNVDVQDRNCGRAAGALGDEWGGC